MTTAIVHANQLRAGDTILTDPLDGASAADIAELCKSQHTSDVAIVMVLQTGEFAQATLKGDAEVVKVI